jgi:hypothetical protein
LAANTSRTDGKGSDMSQYEIVVFEVRRDADGLYTATSPDLTGVCVAHRDFDKIVNDMPDITRLWFKRNKGIDISVYQGPTETSDNTVKIPVIPVPAEIAAQALAR